MSEDISRRQFLKWIPRKAIDAKSNENQPEKDILPIRPPGAIEEKDFVNTCEKCHECSNSCPYDVIFHLEPLYGKKEGTPYLNPEESPCRWCVDFPCIQACPSGALYLAKDEKPKPIAKVTFALQHCLNAQGTLCDDCAPRCPSSIKAIKSGFLSIDLNKDKCVGCGLCSNICPTNPKAFTIDYVDKE